MKTLNTRDLKPFMNLYHGRHQVIGMKKKISPARYPVCRNFVAIVHLSHYKWFILCASISLFTAVYDDSECGGTLSDFEGFVHNDLISTEKKEYVRRHGLQLDCMWVLEVDPEWKVRCDTQKCILTQNLLKKCFFHFQIQLSFTVFKLEKPNDCDSNFVDIFGENTDIPSRWVLGQQIISVISRINIHYV